MLGIYCYIDKKNDEIVYVGKDSNIHIDKRHKQHFYPSRYDDQQINRVLQNNPDRYTYKRLWKIENCTDNHLNEMEKYYVKKYNPKFNFTDGGGGMLGFKHSEETKKKMSEAKKGEKNSFYGKKHSEESKKKMRENHAHLSGEDHPWYGKHHSEEVKRNLSKIHNTSGYFRVRVRKDKRMKNGIIYVYRYFEQKKRKEISSVDINRLKEKVLARGLKWEEF